MHALRPHPKIGEVDSKTMTGELRDDMVIVADQSEGSRLYTKGNFGYPRSGGGLDLDLVEATYLVEASRLTVEKDGVPMGYGDMFRHASSL